MTQKRVLLFGLAGVAAQLLMPTLGYAQGASGIAGVVKDTTGAVLPGVTVEATSPSLIEKVRTVVTDAQGQYKIVDVPPGTYAVTFTLPGFSPIKREGVELVTNFTANVNADLKVGSVEETVTVSGSSPVVDVQNVLQQAVMSDTVIDAVPTGRSMQDFGALIPGMVLSPVSRISAQDVGGTAAGTPNTMAIHGGRSGDMQELINGLPQNSVQGMNTGGITTDVEVAQEMSFELAAVSAEGASGGVRINMIPKAGGNQFKGEVFGNYTNHNLESDNTSTDLVARGLKAVNQLYKNWDLNPSVGGPISKDKVWFFFSARYWGSYDSVAGMWYNATPLAFSYTPDLTRRALDDTWRKSGTLNLTWQATPKNKFTLFALNQARCTCHNNVSSLVAPEAAAYQIAPTDLYTQATWTSPITNRFLISAGVMRYVFFSPRVQEPGVANNVLSVTELSTGLEFRAAPTYPGHNDWNNAAQASLSYITGSHALKVGFTYYSGKQNVYQLANSSVALQFLNGVPKSLTEYASPNLNWWNNLNDAVGLYAQDQWTIRRMTLNLGLRYDHHNESVPAQSYDATFFLPARSYASVSNVPNWNDVNPRTGVSFDLFGNGKTALKATLSRYVLGETIATAQANNPANTSVNSVTRTWNDVTGTFNPVLDCDLTSPAANGGCGKISNAAFGSPIVTTHYDPAVLSGWGVRPYQWETTTGIQQELMPNVSMNATYFRRWYGNFTVTNNMDVAPADYDPYCITAPVDSRLPSGGGYQVCGLYDIKPAKFGQVNNLVTFAKQFGSQWEHYNGFDLTVNARLKHGTLLQGGFNVGRSETNNCFVVNSPQQLQYCDVKPPFQPQVKFLGSMPLPWSLQASGSFQTLPGPQITAPQVVPNAQIQPSLGRNLAAGAGATATINLVSPGTMFDTRLYQLDGRLSRIFSVGRTRIQAIFDVYNALNGNAVLVVNSTYGPAWQQPTYILPGRLFKFGTQINF